MKTTEAILAVALLVGASACSTSPSHAPSDPLIGAWVVSQIDGVPLGQSPAARVSFAETGQVSGDAGCNRFNGAYSLQVATGSIVVTPLGVTRRACPQSVLDAEARIISRLQKSNRATAQPDGGVMLSGTSGVLVIQRPGAQAARAANPSQTIALAPAATPATPSPVLAPAPAAPPPSTSSYDLAGGPGADTAKPPLLYPPVSIASAQAPSIAAPSAKPEPSPPVSAPPSMPQSSVTPAPTASAVAQSATPAAPQTRPAGDMLVASGTVTFAADSPLPADAKLHVQLRATPRNGGRITVLSELERAIAGAPPFPFTLDAPAAFAPANTDVGVVARITSAGRPLYINTGVAVLSAATPGAPLSIQLAPVAATPKPPSPQAVSSTGTGAPPKPVPPVPAPPVAPRLTASAPGDIPDAAYFQCGGERIGMRSQGQTALVSTPGSAVTTLPVVQVSSDPDTPLMFSNGVLTLITSPDGRQIRFARGRVPLVTCKREG